MALSKRSVLVVGGGVMGVTAALELARRGCAVSLMDAGPIPCPRAASTDISKLIRMDYGSDELYLSMMEEAFPAWDRWNREWQEPPYHESGFLLLTESEMVPGDFEYESSRLLRKRGYRVEEIQPNILKSRYPAWRGEKYAGGYFNPRAGWAESARVVEHLAGEARAAGVTVMQNLAAVSLGDRAGKISGVVASDGQSYRAEIVVLAAGAWSPLLSPRLAKMMRHVAQPVFHFHTERPELYRGEAFPAWAADISKTGWYGFPANRDGIIKVANHGTGRTTHPDDPRNTTPEEEARCREFLRESLPGLANASLVASRTCFYADTWDGNFYIDHDPERPGLVYASGDSGHAFKFAPLLGKLVADVVERKPNPYAARFAWRPRGGTVRREQARHWSNDA